MSTLIQTSKRLQVDRITAIVRDLREPRAALRRIGVLLIYSAVVQLVAERGAATGLQPEAQHVLGVLYAFLLISVGWAALLHRSKDLQEKAWIDVAGSLVNFIGIAILLRVGWNVMLPFVAALPLCCITIGALHNRKEFFVSLLFSVLVVFTSAPSGYWLTRPFVGMLAAALLVGLPLTVMRLMRGLREVSIEAVKARDAHSRFLASMSHELRTPLNSVVAASEALQTDEHPERRRQLMHLLAVNALVLQNRVNDVLDVRAIEAGRLAIKIQPFTFAGVLKTVSAVVTPQARSKVIDLKFIAGDAKDVVLRSAPDRLEQMLTNLVTNAIKFTPEHGRVEVRVQLFPAKDNLVNAHVTVSDTGIGIPMEVRKKIFDPFFQVNDGISSRVTDGVGLGLFIVSGIAKLMGGVIDVEDNEGGGSVFNLFLSMERAAPGERPSQTLEQREALADHRRKVRQLHCLVVDDNASNREIAARLMHRAGHTLVLASNGDEAIKRLESEPFDVMFLDLFMPGKTGWVVLDHFQEQRAKGKAVPPIVVMSADANPEAMDAASEKGVVSRAATTSMADVAKELDVPWSIIRRMINTPPGEVEWLSLADLRLMGTTVGRDKER